MYLRYFLNENGDRQYTLATIDPSGKPTLSAHPGRIPNNFIIVVIKDNQYNISGCSQGGNVILIIRARFSPEDKYSRQRITIKKRFGLLLTQQPEPIH